MPKYLLENHNTERLLFRKFVPSDFELWLPFYDEPSSTEFWEGLPKNPIEACRQQFDRIFERYDCGLGGMNALILKSTHELIGMCGLLIQTVDSVEELEIGYSLLPKFRKQGFAIEAAQRCKNYAFESDLADSLISIIHVDNVPSQAVALKNGMQLSATTNYKENPVHIFRIKKP